MRKISFGLRGPLREITGTRRVGSVPSSSRMPCFPTQVLLRRPPPPSPPPSHTQVCPPSSLPFRIQLTSLESHYSPPQPLSPPTAVPVCARQICHTVWGSLNIHQLSMEADFVPVNLNCPQVWARGRALLLSVSHSSPQLSQAEWGLAA